MTRLKLHYDGWVQLPADLRRTLGLDTDGLLEAEPVEGTIVLRPAAGKTNGEGKEAIDAPRTAAAASEPRTRPVPPVAARGPGTKPAGAILPPTLRSRGRRKGRGAAPASQR